MVPREEAQALDTVGRPAGSTPVLTRRTDLGWASCPRLISCSCDTAEPPKDLCLSDVMNRRTEDRAEHVTSVHITYAFPSPRVTAVTPFRQVTLTGGLSCLQRLR